MRRRYQGIGTCCPANGSKLDRLDSSQTSCSGQMKKRITTRMLQPEPLESRHLLTGDAVSLPILSINTSDLVEFLPRDTAQVVTGLQVDLNGDSRLDYLLATTSFNGVRSDGVRVFLADEVGDFREVASASLRGEVRTLHADDLNADGRMDVLVGTSSQVAVFINKGTSDDADAEWRGFQDPLFIATGVNSFDTGDFDGDEVPDLVLGTIDGVEVRRGLGNGSFDEPIHYLTQRDEKQVVTGDLNLDGHPDLVVGMRDQAKVVVLGNTGDGVFEVQQEIGEVAAVRTMDIVTMNSDAFPDLIVGSFEQEGNNVHIWLGDGTTQFVADPLHYETIGSPLDFAVADLNEDGRNDLIVGHDSTFHHPITNNGPGGVTLFLGATAGGLTEGVRVSTPGAADVTVSTGADGRPEIAAIHQWGNTLARMQWVDQSEFVKLQDHSPEATNASVFRSSVVGDFNGDGRHDVVVTDLWTPGKSFLFLGTPDGEYERRELEFGNELTVSGHFVGDFNGDGRDDLGVNVEGKIRGVALSNADGTFGELVTSQLPNNFIVYQAKVADANGDGIDDLLGVETSGGTVYVRAALGKGDGTWEVAPRAALAAPWVSELLVGDVDGDGVVDVIAMSSESVEVGLGNGQGEFEVRKGISGTSFIYDSGDVNGDGRTDLVTAAFDDSPIRILLGTEDGSLSPTSSGITGDRFQTLGLLDLNEDGKDELFVGSTDGFELFRLTEDSYASLGSYSVGFFPDKLDLVDVNGDGTQDLVISPGGNLISSSPSTHVAIIEGQDDGFASSPVVVVVPITDGSVGMAARTDAGAELLITHRRGFATLRGAALLEGDFDGDGQIGTPDISLLCDAAHRDDLTEEEVLRFDVSGDGVVSAEDVDQWVLEIAETFLGDVNLDGTVDFSDFLILSSMCGESDTSWTDGDLDCDGTVGFSDFLILSADYGKSVEK